LDDPLAQAKALGPGPVGRAGRQAEGRDGIDHAVEGPARIAMCRVGAVHPAARRVRGRPRGAPMKRFRAGTRRASRRGVGDPRVAYLLYGTLAAAYGLSVWSIIRQRHRGERAPTRATAPEIAPHEALAQQRASWARFPS